MNRSVKNSLCRLIIAGCALLLSASYKKALEIDPKMPSPLEALRKLVVN